jgi:hypothetical protein
MNAAPDKSTPMSMNSKCSNCRVGLAPPKQVDSYQPFPQAGQLFQNLNLSLDDLRLKISTTQATVYSYIIATIENLDGSFGQRGSAPNFQGNIISLCTCKRFMRTFLDKNSWPDKWIAGFTGIKAGKGKNALVYLMKVGLAFESYYDLWVSEKLPDAVKHSKLASKNRHGDVFQPKNELKDEDVFNPQNYYPPLSEHIHKDVWHKDICCCAGGRRAPLLTGDEKHSFLWNKPVLFYSHQLHRGQKKDNLQSFLVLLQQ